MVRPDPADAARAIAADLRAELAIGGVETERALQRLGYRFADQAALEHRDLDALADAMRRAEAIRDRTRAAEAARVSQSLNTKVAIHPDTIRRAAAELVAAEAALDAAIVGADKRRRRGRRWRIALGTIGLGAGAASAVLVVPAVGLVVAAVGLIAAIASGLRARRRPAEDHTSLRGHCELCRTRWEQVAGARADPHDLERTIHRYDPHDPVVSALVVESPALRAAERAAVARRMAWVAAWRREVGDSSPLADPAVAELLARDHTQLWLGEDAAPDGSETLVVAAPYADLPEDRARDLHRQLLHLPRGQRVIVVLAPDPDAPTGIRVPGVGWVPAASHG